MLVLSRHIGQTIVIGRDISVKVVGIRGGSVRLGIEAPRQVVVDRQEVHDRKVTDPRPGANGDVPHDSP
jgi:carbon storage regulator